MRAWGNEPGPSSSSLSEDSPAPPGGQPKLAARSELSSRSGAARRTCLAERSAKAHRQRSRRRSLSSGPVCRPRRRRPKLRPSAVGRPGGGVGRGLWWQLRSVGGHAGGRTGGRAVVLEDGRAAIGMWRLAAGPQVAKTLGAVSASAALPAPPACTAHLRPPPCDAAPCATLRRTPCAACHRRLHRPPAPAVPPAVAAGCIARLRRTSCAACLRRRLDSPPAPHKLCRLPPPPAASPTCATPPVSPASVAACIARLRRSSPWPCAALLRRPSAPPFCAARLCFAPTPPTCADPWVCAALGSGVTKRSLAIRCTGEATPA